MSAAASPTVRRPLALSAVPAVLRGHRFRYRDEDQLQQAIAQAIAEAGWPVEREVRLSSRRRIDLVVGLEGVAPVGIEVKIAGETASVRRQLEAYAAFDELAALILVTTRARHTQLPSEVGGKPLEIVSLMGGGL